MNKEKLIELGLTEEQATAVVDGFGKMIPKSRFDDKVEEVNDYKQQIAERDTQLAELQQKAAGNEELQQQIISLQEQNEQTALDYKQQLQQKDFDFALTEALRDAKAKNPKAVKALLDSEAIKFEDGKLSGLSEQLDLLKASDDYLFVVEGLKGNTPPQGGQPPAITKEQFSSMSYTEKVELYNKDGELYKQLSE